MPWDLQAAISQASMVLSWYEHIPEEDLPPRWMWHLTEELERHFEALKDKRKNGNQDDDEDWAPGDTIKNEYARGRGR